MHATLRSLLADVASWEGPGWVEMEVVASEARGDVVVMLATIGLPNIRWRLRFASHRTAAQVHEALDGGVARLRTCQQALGIPEEFYA